MSARCTECGASTLWDDDAGSFICTSCGTLTDPSQSILDSHISRPDSSTTFNDFNVIWDSNASATLKSFRHHGANWNLAGQGKEAHDRKNAFAMAEFIKSLAMSFNASGLSPRAETLFNQVRAASKFRWGRRAKLVAGACLSLALRESNRPDSLRDIAFVLNESYPSLTRCFTSIISLLNLKLVAVDPSSYISAFQSHLTSALDDVRQENGLPSVLIKDLSSICLHGVAATANSLSDLVIRMGPDNPVGQLPVPPTACALYMLALEAERRTSIKQLGELAQFFGKRCHFCKDVIMSRYKLIQDIIASLAEKVPWLTKYETKKGRASVSKRNVVARGIKDVLIFHDQIWREIAKPQLVLEVLDRKANSRRNSSCRVPLSKRRKLQPSYDAATRFLLDPLSAELPTANIPEHLYHKSPTDPNDGYSSSSSAAPVTAADMPLISYILSSPLMSWSSKRSLTRLQLLSVERGGAGPDEIGDDELFEEGELEGLLRNEEEVNIIRQTMDWGAGIDSSGEEDVTAPPPIRKKRKRGAEEVNVKKSRLNMDALANFLRGNEDGSDGTQFLGLEDTNFGNTLPDDFEDCKDDEEYSPESSRIVMGGLEGRDEHEVIVDEWRPPSPGATGDATDWFNEEYD
ncbi:hypothetical protein BDQ17DRAFT_1235756 [Cyathus striatus]|nr:hypothetical protein BDQ17DRAFT_1235756 [Cyathus striatus]